MRILLMNLSAGSERSRRRREWTGGPVGKGEGAAD